MQAPGLGTGADRSRISDVLRCLSGIGAACYNCDPGSALPPHPSPRLLRVCLALADAHPGCVLGFVHLMGRGAAGANTPKLPTAVARQRRVFTAVISVRRGASSPSARGPLASEELIELGLAGLYCA